MKIRDDIEIDEVTDEDRIEIGRLINEGYTSGRLDLVANDGKKSKFIAWELKTEMWVE